MKFKCKTCNQIFDDFERQTTWDYWIDCCPYCAINLHEGKFEIVKEEDNENRV
jgi:hypothetical protein